MSLLNAIADFRNLCAAWERVRARGGCAGIDGVTLERFERRWRHRLARIREQLLAKRYWPLPNRRFFIPKGSHGFRALAVPTVRDRVAQAAVLEAVGDELSSRLHDACYAYRRGRSILQAIDRIESLHRNGYQWVVESDIRRCFDSFDHPLLLKRWRAAAGSDDADWLIERWLGAGVGDMGRWERMSRGVPQGSVISPLLCNLYLDPFDREMARRGFGLIRYADDFVLLCKDRPQAEAALRSAASFISRLRLELASDKTRICSFEDGFAFLGAAFRGWEVQRPAIGARYGRRLRHVARGNGSGVSASEEQRKSEGPRWDPLPLDPSPTYLPISGIVSYCFCPRAFYYRYVIGEEPQSTALEVGRARHRLRSLRMRGDTSVMYEVGVVSDRLQLVGRADAVEVRWNVVYPVEFKATKTRSLWPGFLQQLCAQGMALEENMGEKVAFGYLEFLPTGQRELIVFDQRLRSETAATAVEMRRLVERAELPSARPGRRCGPCSMRPVCMPEDLDAAEETLSLEP